MFSIDIALKLGANEIIVYRKGVGIIAKVPAYLAVVEKGKRMSVKAVGKEAEEMFLNGSSNITIYQPIKNGEILNEKKAVVLFNKILEETLNDKFLLTKLHCLVCVPSALTEDNLLIIKRVLLNSGVTHVEFVQNAVCVSKYLNLPEENQIMVVDIGKGMTDMSITSQQSFDFGRVYFIGGEDMDKSITTFIEDNHDLLVSDLTSESIKNEIASLYERDLYRTEYVGIDKDGKFMYHDITASEVRVALLSIYEKIMKKIDEVMSEQTKEVQFNINNNGIVFVGGASQIQGLFEFASSKLKYPVIVAEEPDDAVILGAGKLLNERSHLTIEL